MSPIQPHAIARELRDAYAHCQTVAIPPSGRYAGFDLSTAYAVEAELVRLRAESGRTPVGRKVGFANKAVWRVLKLDTLVWAHIYDDTVRYAHDNTHSLSVGRLCSPRIEPEIVFKLKDPLEVTDPEPAVVLAAVEWLALGFEIIDCVYAEWKFQPADFVAAYGLHSALVVGQQRPVRSGSVSELVDELPRFKVRLCRNGQLVQEGSGRNSLRSPALCLGELASAVSRQSPPEPLRAGELVSSGTLTEPQPIASGEIWTAALEGLALPALTLHTTG